jgi:glycosyltransferase involved in cell wall biosynthesis
LKRVGGTVRTAARIQRKPYVVSLHGGVFDVPAAELEQMSEPTKGKLEWGRSFGALLGSRRVLEDADHVICVGQSEWEEARKKLCHDRVSYLPNGVDAARFSRGDRMKFRARYAIRQHDHVVLNVSRIDAQKNQVLLVEAFARFRAEKPNSILVLIGPETSPAYARSIRQKIDDLGLATCVRMLPGFPAGSSELVDAYHAADVFVLPSRHEPFGIVVLEAWSAGKPVIVSDIGGLKALVQDGVTGLKFDSSANDAAEQLAGKIKVLADDSVLRRTIAQNGMSSARTNYDWSRIHQQLETIYQKAEAFAQRSK